MEDTATHAAIVKLEQAGTRVLNKYPPIYTVALKGLLNKESDIVQSIAFTGREILFNVDFVNNISEEVLDAMLLHDALHILCGHPFLKFATAKNIKVRDKFHRKLDNEVLNVMISIGCPNPNVSGGQHDFWPTLERVFNEMGGNFLPWLKVEDVYTDHDAKILDITYQVIRSTPVYTPHYAMVNCVRLDNDRAFITKKNGQWVRVSKHDNAIRELIEAYNMAGTLMGDSVKLSTRTKSIAY